MRLLAVLGLAALLVACGRGDGDDLAIDDAGTGEQATPEDTAQESTDGDADPDVSDEGAADDDAGTDDGNGGVGEHRPPDDAESFADCGSIDTMDPGARIVFPSDDVAGSLDAGPGPVTVEVVGCGNTFEANVQWEAYHGQNANPTLEGFTMGGTMGEWGAFSITETYWTPGDWTVVVFEIDAESGERREYDEVTFTVG